MRERDWQLLIRSLQNRDCIVLLGPDVPSGSPTEPGHHLLSSLADALRQELGDRPDLPAGLPYLADEYRRKFTRQELDTFVHDFYRARADEVSPALSCLAALPVPLVLTSRHDLLMEQAFRARGKLATSEFYSRRGDKSVIRLGTVEQPLVYHLYGSIEDPHLSLVLTEHDLIDLLVHIIGRDPELPTTLRAAFNNPNKSLLFLGFGVHQWHLRVLLHVLRNCQPTGRSFAMESFDNDRARFAKEDAVLFFRSADAKIEIVETAPAVFMAELETRWAALRPLPAAAVERSDVGPSVFMCHASEDYARIRQIYDRLRDEGVRAWISGEQLIDGGGIPAGGQWESAIRDQLDATNYVFVFHSEHLHRKIDSYVNREIAIALERARDIRKGFRFIIPVLLDRAPLIDELKPYQAVAFEGSETIRDLVSIVKRDYQLRAIS